MRPRKLLASNPFSLPLGDASLRPVGPIITLRLGEQVMYRTSSAFSAQRVIILTVVTAMLAFLAGRWVGRSCRPPRRQRALWTRRRSRTTSGRTRTGPTASSRCLMSTVAITGDGSGAKATATVGANGAVTGPDPDKSGQRVHDRRCRIRRSRDRRGGHRHGRGLGRRHWRHDRHRGRRLHRAHRLLQRRRRARAPWCRSATTLQTAPSPLTTRPEPMPRARPRGPPHCPAERHAHASS